MQIRNERVYCRATIVVKYKRYYTYLQVQQHVWHPRSALEEQLIPKKFNSLLCTSAAPHAWPDRDGP